MLVPKGILFWIFLSNIIVFFDAFFVINRPHTLANGKYYWLFKPYENYYKFDSLYAMNDDTFVVIQSWLNVCEGVISMIAVVLCLSSCKIKRAIGSIICLIVSVMVFWKTVIFLWYDNNFLSEDAKNYTPESILYYYFPSSLWIIFPLLSIILISKRFVQAVTNEASCDQPKK